MIRKLKSYFGNAQKYSRLKARTRMGIPECLRGYVWQVYAEADKYREKGNYYQMLGDTSNGELTHTEREILKDIDRTVPNNTFFKDKLGLGQRSLFNVLSTFSKHNPDLGYYLKVRVQIQHQRIPP